MIKDNKESIIAASLVSLIMIFIIIAPPDVKEAIESKRIEVRSQILSKLQKLVFNEEEGKTSTTPHVEPPIDEQYSDEKPSIPQPDNQTKKDNQTQQSSQTKKDPRLKPETKPEPQNTKPKPRKDTVEEIDVTKFKNGFHWSEVPKISTKKELVTYLKKCESAGVSKIPVQYTKGFWVGADELAGGMILFCAILEVEEMYDDDIDGRIVYHAHYYPGSKVATAYLTKDTSNLNSEEMKLYNVAVEIVNEANKNCKTPLSKELYIHNVICNRTEYYTEENWEGVPRYITAIGALIDGRANCQGYSDAFYMLATMCNFKVGRVSGSGRGIDHVWNTINLDGKNYFVDVTWDDPTGSKNYDDGYSTTYVYFNAPVEIMQTTHVWKREYEFEQFQESMDKNYFFLSPEFSDRGFYCGSAEEALSQIARKIVENNGTRFFVMSPYDGRYAEGSSAVQYVSDEIYSKYSQWIGNYYLSTTNLGNKYISFLVIY